ncbi:PREDICTED: histamine H2 receptor isoform X1 [Myotis davidii]|uniref:histamine H2 receptor isoform X1 n=1 Tax=Myotis davidii TaxID=225400 RepID=UPI0003EBD38A|nr:PREDICTED: histamine H2 receptor isoform X1 [Myotis davidii]XP_015420589.1 PREDICTED: histamine H2 receptor isoform X1 [Myotis davidii]XP_015420590.1 PREDICTED: histamine H2 receptor isoform X1 [Myotis davidii]XP_015420591.1 PREDICTED: histamine H2 receptor isoform X1 [Myotis davidii]
MEANDTAASSCLDSAAFKVTVSVALTVLILVTIAGNVVVCLAVGLSRQLRSLTNCFIVSLAITDLLLGLLVMPFSAFYQLSCRWSFGKVFCNIYTSLDVMLCTASILNLFMISLDRYCAVTDPLRYPVLITPVRVGVSLVLIWAVSITLSFLSIHLGWNSRDETSAVNHTIQPCKVQVNLVYGLVDGLVTFYVPLLVMCITYFRIFKIAREQAKRIHHVGSWKAATVREHKATVTLATVMGAFIVCWFPYFTVFVYRGLRGDDAVNKTFEAVVLWLGYANSALNPILYAALNRDFRTAYQQLLRCRYASCNAHDASLRYDSSRLPRTRSQGPRQQEEKPLKLQVWSGREVMAPRGATDRKPALSCAVSSSNLLSCYKSLWGHRLLQRCGGGPSEQPLRTPPSQAA